MMSSILDVCLRAWRCFEEEGVLKCREKQTELSCLG